MVMPYPNIGSLSINLKYMFLEDLKGSDIGVLDEYANYNKEIINFLYTQKIIDDASIEKTLEEMVFKYARDNYNIMLTDTNYQHYADHIGKQECFAYALEKNIFKPKELKKIPFDHGDDVASYIKTYRKDNLLSIIREELLNPKPLPEFKGRYSCCGMPHD